MQTEADDCDASPAAGPHGNGFTAVFNQLDDVSIQTDCSHSQHDEKLAQFFDWCKEGGWNAKVNGDSSDNRRTDKKQNKEWENLFKIYFVFTLLIPRTQVA